MNYEATRAFEKDLSVIRHPKLLRQIADALVDIKTASALTSLPSVTPMVGHPSLYRIRVGDYRIGCRLEGETLVLARVLHRKDIYRYFP